jgi:phosphatidylserine decarboxylase
MARRPTIPSPTTTQHLVDLVRHTLPPLHPAGRPFVAGGLAITVMGLHRPWARHLGLALTLAAAAFFRHPNRVTPSGTDLVVAPADGEVCLIDEAVPPAELEWTRQPLPHVSTFLSLFDVHVQRAPVSGVITHSAYAPGQFRSADVPEASAVNERQSLVIKTASGASVGVVQIAGLVARRILCQVAAGDGVSAGETYGLIRFGSRVDLYLPPASRIEANLGQRAVGGETILARLP